MRKNFLLISIFILGYSIFAFWNIAFPKDQISSQKLLVSVLDVGQGDAILIQTPNGKNILVDGGPEDVVVNQLKKSFSKKDATIDMLVITNPDADHIAGFSSVVDTYKVLSVLEPGTRSQTSTYKNLIKKIKEKNIQILGAYKDMKIVLDEKENIYLDILFPDQKVRGWTSNDGSIVMRLVYKETSMMLMGDATELTEKIIMVTTDKERLKSDILKVGHHGSKTSTSEVWLQAIDPPVAVISLGLGNRYGHPHEEVIERLQEKEVEILRTDQEGTVTFESDGNEFSKLEK